MLLLLVPMVSGVEFNPFRKSLDTLRINLKIVSSYFQRSPVDCQTDFNDLYFRRSNEIGNHSAINQLHIKSIYIKYLFEISQVEESICFIKELNKPMSMYKQRLRKSHIVVVLTIQTYLQ